MRKQVRELPGGRLRKRKSKHAKPVCWPAPLSKKSSSAPLSALCRLLSAPILSFRERISYGVGFEKKFTRLPSGSRSSNERFPQGISVGSMTQSTLPLKRLCTPSTSST